MKITLMKLLYMTNNMNNCASEALLRSQTSIKKPIENYIELFQNYTIHSKLSFSYLKYFLITHVVCTTIRHIAVYLFAQTQSFLILIFNYSGYVVWAFLLLHYRANYPSMDPHSVYNKQQNFLFKIKVATFTFQLILCLLLLAYLILVHLCLTNDKCLPFADFILVLLSLRSIYQTHLQQQQIDKALKDMHGNKFYTIEGFAIEDMKQPFEIAEIQGDVLIRNSSLDLIVPGFMHSFYKPKKTLRIEDEDHIDQTQLYSR